MEVEMTGDLPTLASIQLRFTLTAIKGVSEWTSIFADEPSLKRISMSWVCRGNGSSLRVSVVLDSSLIGCVEGLSIAERIRKRIEGVWGVEFSSVDNKSFPRVFLAEEYSLQKLREIFLQYCPSEGFGKILHSMIFWDYVDIDLDLELDEENKPVWDILLSSRHDEYLYVIAHQEYTVSLKELTGYAGPIQSSPQSLSSVLYVKVLKTDERFRLICSRHLPKAMNYEEIGTGTLRERGQIILEYSSRTFVRDIRHGSADDLAVSFLLGSGPVTLLLGPLAAFGAVVAIGYLFAFGTRARSTHVFREPTPQDG